MWLAFQYRGRVVKADYSWGSGGDGGKGGGTQQKMRLEHQGNDRFCRALSTTARIWDFFSPRWEIIIGL